MSVVHTIRYKTSQRGPQLQKQLFENCSATSLKHDKLQL